MRPDKNEVMVDISSPTQIRRAGRVAEGAPLLRAYTLIRIEGSNPSLSAIKQENGFSETNRFFCV